MPYRTTEFSGQTIFYCPLPDCETTTYSEEDMDIHCIDNHPSRVIVRQSPVLDASGEPVLVEEEISATPQPEDDQ